MSSTSHQLPPSQKESLSIRRIRVFENRQGNDALLLAAHAAFPSLLTTHLVYCIRENFTQDVSWYSCGDLLLSGLCQTVGFDLYEMDGPARYELLQQLRQTYGDNRLYELQAFMDAYNKHNPRQSCIALNEFSEWTVLACLQPEEAVSRMNNALHDPERKGNSQQQIQTTAVIDHYVDFLAETPIGNAVAKLIE